MNDIALREIGGWWLPPKDGYFDRYVEGSTGKKNGFQLDHLEEAFKHVRAWNVAIDVGAHIGFWTVPMAHRFAKVYAFEPAPDCYACLLRNTAEFGDKVVTANCAVGKEPGSVELYDDRQRGGNTGARFVRPDLIGKIKMLRLDDLRLQVCDFLKVDVEGFELMVLRGAKETIERCKPVISMETDKKFAWERYRIENTAADHFLLKLGYSVAAHMRPDKVFVPL